MVKSGSTTVSLRISRKLKDALEKEASRRHLTLNSMAIESLHKSIEWDPLSEGFEHVHVSRQIMAAFLEQIEEKKLVLMGRKLLPPRLGHFARVLRGRVDLLGFKMVVDTQARYLYSRPTVHTWSKRSGILRMVIRHRVSRKWAIFIGEGYVGYLRGIGVRAWYKVTDTSLALTLRITNEQCLRELRQLI